MAEEEEENGRAERLDVSFVMGIGEGWSFDMLKGFIEEYSFIRKYSKDITGFQTYYRGENSRGKAIVGGFQAKKQDDTYDNVANKSFIIQVYLVRFSLHLQQQLNFVADNDSVKDLETKFREEIMSTQFAIAMTEKLTIKNTERRSEVTRVQIEAVQVRCTSDTNAFAASRKWKALSRASIIVQRRGVEGKDMGKESIGEELYSSLQWETSCFYTYECELDGIPVSEDQLRRAHEKARKQRESTNELQDVKDREDGTLHTTVVLGVTRLGSSDRRASIRWCTLDDRSAKPGVHYVPVSGETIMFEKGETHKTVVLKVLPSRSFEGTLEVGVYLDERSVQGAFVGKYLHTSQVKIIDQSAFPSDVVRNAVEGGDEIPKVRQGTCKRFCLEQYKNVVAIFNIELLRRIVNILQNVIEAQAGIDTPSSFDNITAYQSIGDVDHESHRSDGNDKREQTELRSVEYSAQRMIAIFALLLAGVLVGSHVLDYLAVNWGITSTLRKHLQTLLLKKFLFYNDDSRSQVALDRLLMAMTRDVANTVGEVYNLSISVSSGPPIKVFLLVCYLVFVVYGAGKDPNLQSWVACYVVVQPALIGIFLVLRNQKGSILRQAQFDSETRMVDSVIESVLNFNLINDYDHTTETVHDYGILVDNYNKATREYSAYLVNSTYFAPHMTNCLVGAWVAQGAIMIIDQRITLDVYLSTIFVFRAIGTEMERAYDISVRIMTGYSSLVQLCIFMNLPVDVPKRLKVFKSRRRVGQVLRDDVRDRSSVEELMLTEQSVAVDELPILVRNVGFSYEQREALSQRTDATSRAPKLFSGGVKEKKAEGLPSILDRKHHLGNPLKFAPKTQKEVAGAACNPPVNASSHSDSEENRLEAVIEPPVVEKALVVLQSAFRARRARSTLTYLRRQLRLRNLSLDIKQGRCVGIVGPPNSGKATLLKLITQTIFPQARRANIAMTDDASALSENSAKVRICGRLDSPGSLENHFLPRRRFSLRSAATIHIREHFQDLEDGQSTGEHENIEGGGRSLDFEPVVFVPPHLRVVPIQEHPYVLGPHATVLDNLVYGIKSNPNTDWVKLENRARRVLQALGGDPEVLANLKTENYLGVEGRRLTRMQRHLISLARALVMNPEVLVVHKPTQLLCCTSSRDIENKTAIISGDNRTFTAVCGDENHSPDIKVRVMMALTEFVRNRGFLMNPDEPIIRRRKRTVIFTTDSLEEAMAYADVVFSMDGMTGIRKLKS